jgi:uncharacterized protein YegL
MKFRKESHRREEAVQDRLDPLSVKLGQRGTFMPLVLALDPSYSMSGAPIEKVNETLREVAAFLKADTSFVNSVRVATVTFGTDGVLLWKGDRRVPRDEDPFELAADWQPPVLTAQGVTPLTEGLTLAVECVEREKARMKAELCNYNRPVIWLLSDGVPTDANGIPTSAWRDLVPKLSGSERQFRLYALYTPDIPPEGKAALDDLSSFAWPLDDFSFADVLPLLSASMISADSDPRAQDDNIQRIYDTIVLRHQQAIANRRSGS